MKYQYFDEYSRDCEKWLAKNYKTEYHVVDELRGAPTLSNGGLDDQPPPLILGGQLWHPVETRPVDREDGRRSRTRAAAAAPTSPRRRRRRSEPDAREEQDHEEHRKRFGYVALVVAAAGLGCGGGNKEAAGAATSAAAAAAAASPG